MYRLLSYFRSAPPSVGTPVIPPTVGPRMGVPQKERVYISYPSDEVTEAHSPAHIEIGVKYIPSVVIAHRPSFHDS